MAVEINELVIRAVAVDDKSKAEGKHQPINMEEWQQKLVNDCVKEVLRILNRKSNR